MSHFPGKKHISDDKTKVTIWLFSESTTGNHFRWVWQIPYGNIVQDLKKIILVAKIKMVQADKSAIPNDTHVAPESNILYNLFSSLRMYINSVEVCQVQDYPIYAYVSSKIGSTQHDQLTHMVPAGFIPDDLKKMDNCSDTNKGYQKRRYMCRIYKTQNVFTSSYFFNLGRSLAMRWRQPPLITQQFLHILLMMTLRTPLWEFFAHPSVMWTLCQRQASQCDKE